jgi:hypothetical protein
MRRITNWVEYSDNCSRCHDSYAALSWKVSALYSRGTQFESQLGHRLFWQRFSHSFPLSLQKMPQQCLKIRIWLLTSTSFLFLIHCLTITLCRLQQIQSTQAQHLNSIIPHFSFWSCIPPDGGQYVNLKHVVENKWWTYRAYVLCLSGLYLLVIDQHNGMMLPKNNVQLMWLTSLNTLQSKYTKHLVCKQSYKL